MGQDYEGTMNNQKGCAGETWTPRIGSRACTRRGVVEHGGKFYCRQHDPEAVIARRKASTAYYDLRMEVVHAENDATDARDAVIRAARALSDVIGGTDMDEPLSAAMRPYMDLRAALDVLDKSEERLVDLRKQRDEQR
jgi:hypothetical protein